ncbi:hypothetical protein Tco_1302253 [Tanacetum coccineum]
MDGRLLRRWRMREKSRTSPVIHLRECVRESGRMLQPPQVRRFRPRNQDVVGVGGFANKYYFAFMHQYRTNPLCVAHNLEANRLGLSFPLMRDADICCIRCFRLSRSRSVVSLVIGSIARNFWEQLPFAENLSISLISTRCKNPQIVIVEAESPGSGSVLYGMGQLLWIRIWAVRYPLGGIVLAPYVIGFSLSSRVKEIILCTLATNPKLSH